PGTAGKNMLASLQFLARQIKLNARGNLFSSARAASPCGKDHRLWKIARVHRAVRWLSTDEAGPGLRACLCIGIKFAKGSANRSSAPAIRRIVVSFGSPTAKRAGRRTGAAVKSLRKR